MRGSWRLGVVATMAVALLVIGCNLGTPSPRAIDTPTPAATATPTTAAVTPEAAVTPSPTPTLTIATGGVPNVAPAGAVVLTTQQVVQQVRPSVVHILTEAARPDFFLNPEPTQGVGTGFILDKEGHIATNNHVVEEALRVTVTLADGTAVQADIVGTDLQTDLAVVKIDPKGQDLQPVALASERASVGEDVVAIGHALDLEGGPTVTKGVISAVGRSVQESQQIILDDMIQTDAAINPGNSGGPLVNMRGEVVGVNTAIIEGSTGIGFAISIGQAKPIIDALMKNGFVPRAYLGISPYNLTAAVARDNGLPVDKGVYITNVVRGGPAQQVGLRAGDIIVAFGDTPIPNTARMDEFLRSHKAGEAVEVAYYRGDAKQTVTVTLGERPRR